ncbi:MAG: efflux transporter outer membrane subunit [Betaproteobacteria bacterium]|nr:efflux transporter outer membrane subunit [Betaproteobacteria bacterium]
MALSALALAGCALKDAPPREDTQRQALPNLVPPPQWTAASAAPGAVADDWLTGLDEPLLKALVAEALAFNADLRVAWTRVDTAAAYVAAAKAPLWPQVNLVARGGGKMSGDSSGIQGVGLFAAWELDLWGRVRAAARSTELQYESARLDTEYARQSVAALVAKAWFAAVDARLQWAQTEAMLVSAEQLAALARERVRVGNGDEYDVSLAQANVESLRDTARGLDLAYANAVRALETLAGRYPAAAIAVGPKLPAWAGDVPAGVPAELLERRPDVAAAERRVAMAFYRTEEAKAARLPRITLVANFTSISSEMFVLQDRNNPLFSFGAGLVQPVFLGGLLQSQVDARTAEQQGAIADYGRVGARAFGEVENALAGNAAATDRERILARAVRENERALELASVRYRVGSGDLRAVQQQQLALHTARAALLRVQADRLVQRVNLHLALGGSFMPAVPTVTGDASAVAR